MQPKPPIDPAQNPSAAREIARMDQIVDSIAALPEIDKPTLEKLFNVSLAHQARAREDDLSYEAPLASGPFDNAFLKVPNPKQNRFLIVGLRVRPGIDINQSALQRRLSGPDVKTEMSAPTQAEPLYTKTVRHPSGYVVKYTFDLKTRRLDTVSVELG